MAGQYIYVENPLSDKPSKLEKERIPPMSEFSRREGLALALPFTRRPIDHLYPDKKVETFPIPLKAATFDPVIVDREKRVLEVGEVSVINFLARMAIAGFRVHNSSKDALAAKNSFKHRQTLKAVNKGFEASGGPSVTSAQLLAFLTNSPRGDNAAFNNETVSKVVSRYLGLGKGASGLGQRISERLVEQASGWGSKSGAPATTVLRAQILCDELGVPGLAESLTQMTESEVPESLVEYGVGKASISYAAPPTEIRIIENALNASDGVLEVGLSSAAFQLGDPSQALSALLSDGPTYNGLSWLLNLKKGLGMWVSATAEDISNYFGCPVEIVRRLQADAQGIAKDYSGAFGKLHDLRNQIGGGLASFGDRYFTRLEELAKTAPQLISLFDGVPFPKTLAAQSGERAFWGTGFTAEDLHTEWKHLASRAPKIQADLACLQGVGERAPDREVLITVEADLDRVRALFGRVRLVLNNLRVWRLDIDAASGKGKVDISSQNSAALNQIQIPNELVKAVGFKGWVSEDGVGERHAEVSEIPSTSVDGPISLPFLARRNTSGDSVASRIENTSSQLRLAKVLAQDLEAYLLSEEPLAERMLSVFALNDQRHYQNRGEDVDDRLLAIQSRRHLLDEWFRFWSSLSRPCVDYAQKELLALDLGYSDDPENKDRPDFRWQKKAHLFMQEQKGALWKSMFAKGKHKPYGLNSEQLLAVDFDGLLTRMTNWLADQNNSNSFAAVAVDFIALKAKRLEMAARVTEVRLDPRHPSLADWPLHVTLSPAEQMKLESIHALGGRDVARIAGRLAVSMRDAASFLNRKAHLDRASFKPVKPLEHLGYLSKTLTADGEDRFWCPPERLWASEALSATLLRELIDERKAVRVSELLGDLKELIKSADEARLMAIRGLLKEMPHTWAIVTDLPGIQGGVEWPASSVLMLGKRDLVSAPRNARIYPLCLTPARANILDECLTGERIHMPGSLLFNYTYERGSFEDPTPKRVEAHIPTSKVASEAADAATSPYLDRLIGIDLGERGIGFAVRDVSLKNYPLVARGFVPVPAIRKLIKATRTYRQRHQKAMSVRTSHVDFSEMRKAVAGNVISVIKYLMKHYQGLPVLEMDLSGLNAGQRQLSHVYSAVTDAFLSRGVPTANKARANTWRGWKIEHPYLERVVVDPKTKATSVQPFNLYPGTGVRAAYTSQRCSGCGVSPIADLRSHSESRVALDQGGCVTLDSGVTLQLFTPSSINAVVAGKGEPKPLTNRVMPVSALISHLKNNQLRVRAESVDSKDTSQSRYWCANVDCEHHSPEQMLHADMNAADNIVMRRCKTLIRKEVE